VTGAVGQSDVAVRKERGGGSNNGYLCGDGKVASGGVRKTAFPRWDPANHSREVKSTREIRHDV